MALTIGSLSTIVDTQVGGADTTLTNKLNNIGAATNVSPVDLIHLQLDVTVFNVAITAVSSVAKSFDETMKGCVNKVS